ncbi:MAG: ABC transporter ATP-binding protein [Bacteroidetes bacterium]|nr:ABC transporter ATP-binding protein [Bacteroidota bacterium]
MKKLIKILHYALSYSGYASLNILFNILSILFSLVSFALFIPILQMLFKTTEIPGTKPPFTLSSFESVKQNFYYEIGRMIHERGEMTVLMYIAISIVVLFFLKNLFRYLGMFFLAPLRNGVVKDIRNEMYLKILILPLSYYTEQKKGDLISRMTSDVQEVEWSIMSSLEMIFREPLTILFFVITLFLISPSLTVFVLVLLPISGYLIGQVGKSLKRTSMKGQRKMGELLSIIEETISGLRIIKAFNAIPSAEQNFNDHNRSYFRLMTRLYRKRDLASPLSEFLGALVMVVVLWFGGRLVLGPQNPLDAATFIVYLGIFSQLIPPAKAITTAVYNIQRGAASVERIEEVLKAEEVIVEKPDARRVSEFKQEIEFRDVCFSYAPADNKAEQEVLKDICLRIPKGRTIALVGPSGAGKTSMINLLPRFYDVTKGEILIDGIPLKDLVISDVRGLMGLVTQESILFNDTVFNNIALGNRKATMEEVEAAARIANAHEFIMKMDNGYFTNIGDRGTKLSGGQKQRLSIARAVLKNPPIMLLDEATSSLDTESERLVQDALINLMKNRTSVVIAHRLSTIQFADEIIVLDNGEIVERGSHQELIEHNGLYKKLHALQSFK